MDITTPIVLADGTLTNVVDSVTNLSVNYKPVTVWYNGQPMTNAMCDGRLYRRKGATYYRQVIDKDGELFLEKDTVSQLRLLNSYEILLLKGSVFKGVRLNGYYEKGDTPVPVEYYLSNTSESDDGGSVFEVGDIKLELKNAVTPLSVKYYGLTNSAVVDSSSKLLKIFTKFKNVDIDTDIYILNLVLNGFSGLNLTSSNNSVIRQLESTENPMITFSNCNSINVSGLTCEGAETKASYTSVNNRRSFLFFDVCNNCSVSNISVTKKTNGVYFNSSSYCSLNNLKMIGLWDDEVPVSGQAYGRNFSPACWVINCQNIDLRRLDIRSSGSGILVGGDSTYITSSNIKIRNTFDNGVYYSSTFNSIIQNSDCIGTAGTGFKARGGGNIIQLCTTDTSNVGISVTDTVSKGGDASSVLYNIVLKTGRRGIEVSRDGVDSFYTKVIGNLVDTANISNTANDAGIIISQRNVFIQGNVIKNITTGFGILKSHSAELISSSDYICDNYFSNVPIAVSLRYCDRAMFSRNIIENCTSGVELRFVTNSIIDSNTITNSVSVASILIQSTYTNTNNIITATNKLNNVSGDLVSNLYLNPYNGRNISSDLTGSVDQRGAIYNRIGGTVDLPMICIKDAANNYKYVRLETMSIGLTTDRPTGMAQGHIHINTTTGIAEYYNGSTWVNIVGNATTSNRGLVNQSVAVANSALADATDLPTAIALVNDLKSKFNSKLAADRTSNQQAT